jgi:hypothetical protein
LTVGTNLLGLELFPDERSFLVGRGIVLHALQDDCVSQPVGNSGARIAMGVFGWRINSNNPNDALTPYDFYTGPKQAISIIQPTVSAYLFLKNNL